MYCSDLESEVTSGVTVGKVNVMLARIGVQTRGSMGIRRVTRHGKSLDKHEWGYL